MHYSHGQLNYSIYAYAQSYADGHTESTHQHELIQLLHTLMGVIHVRTAEGIWVIPASKGIWIPENKVHSTGYLVMLNLEEYLLSQMIAIAKAV